MKRIREGTEGASVLDLVEEAFFLVRRAPASTLASYAIGTVPFLLGLLFFCTDMARSSFAWERLSAGSLLMAILFVWMKVWQSVFACQLRQHLAGEVRTLRWQTWLRGTILQTIIQATGLFLLPIALFLVIPFNWLYPFYQNVTALGFKDDLSLRRLLRQSWRQATIWPMQNLYLLMIFKAFGLVVLLNVASAFLTVPFLLKTLFGVETRLTQMLQDPMTFLSAFFNTTVFSALVGIGFLCLDPLLKAIHVLRCFYGESLASGEDLKADLRRLAAPALAALTVLSCSNVIAAEHTPPPPQTIDSARLDRHIDEVMKQREYVWRLPRERTERKNEPKGLFVAFMQAVLEMLRDAAKSFFQLIEKVVKWIFGNRNLNLGGGSGLSTAAFVQYLLYALVALLVIAVAWLLFQLWRRRGPRMDVVTAQTSPSVPNIADENVSADQLPEDGWLKLARELLERGELRLALRAYYLATLAHLAERNLVTLAKFKSNRDYQTELARRGHALPELFGLFHENVSVFDRIWYGLHEVNRELVDRFVQNVQRINAS